MNRSAELKALLSSKGTLVMPDAYDPVSARIIGLNEAVRRGNLYLEAGADLIFVTGVGTLEEVGVLVKGIQGPVSIAAGMGSNLQGFSVNDLKELDVARVSLPSVASARASRGCCRRWRA